MLKSSKLAALSFGVGALAMSLGSAHAGTFDDTMFGTFPNYGANTNGPALIVELFSDGSATIHTNPVNAQPYDSIEDTYIGVYNNSGQTLNSFNISSSTYGDGGIFNFDFDGITTYGAPGNASDRGGYGGPNIYFTNIVMSGDCYSGVGCFQSGTVNFLTALVDQGTDYFSLEEPLDSASFTAQAPELAATPIPAALPLFASGLGVMGLVARRRKKKLAAAASA